MLTKFPFGISSFGIPMIGSGIPLTSGTYYFVHPTKGSDGNDGFSVDTPMKTPAAAYAKMTTGAHDVMILMAGDVDNPFEVDAMLDVAKNNIHIVGVGNGGATDPEPRIIFSTTGLAVASAVAVVKNSGFGNTFTNVRINSWGVYGTNANVTGLWDAGENAVYTQCQFNKYTDLGLTAVSDVEARGDSTTWRNCKFGSDTMLQTAARPTLLIKGTGANARMKNNYFEDCYFVTSCTQVLKHFIQVNDTNSLAFSNVWKNCVFVCAIVNSLSAVAIDNVVQSASGLNEGNLLFINPSFNATLFCDTGQNTDGVQVVGPQSAADVGEPQTPATS